LKSKDWAQQLLKNFHPLSKHLEHIMINLTPNAVKAMRRFIRGSETPVAGLRLMVSGGGCSGFQYGMRMEAEKAEDDTELEVEGIKLLVDPFSLPMIDEVKIDFIDSLTHTGFKFDNHNASAQCSCGQSFSV
jgi:iron-sulfur cluster assembly protein